MAFIPKGKAKSGPKKQFTDEGDLFAIEFDKAKSFAMQNAQRITEVGKSFAKSFVNFQTTFDKNTKDFAIQQKASFREREEELVKNFSSGPLAEGELLQSFEKLKQYMDDADVSIEKFTGRMESGGVELKKTFDSITDGLDEQEKKQRKLTQAGVATETKITDGKVELVALTKDEIFKKHKNMLMLAEDDSKIRDVEKQLKKMPKHLNKKSTHLIISVGGNDILEKYEKKKESEITTKKIDELFIEYRTLLENIKKTYKLKIVLVNIYLPVAESHVKLHKVIREWNRRQKSYARAKQMKILAIADKFDEPKHFTKKFKPSAEGSKIIAKQVLDI